MILMLKASIIITAYNQAEYVEAALRSALDQDYANLEIVIGEDASTDKTRDIIERVLAIHPRRDIVRLIPVEPNLGLIRNWERVVRLSSGEILIAQAGDDISTPQRVARIAEIFTNDVKIQAVFSQVSIIDAHAEVMHRHYEKNRPNFATYSRQPQGTGFDLWSGAPVVGACGAYRRRIFEDFGPLSLAHSEDEPYVYRALLLGLVAYTPEILLQWRWHGGNLSVGSLVDERSPDVALSKRAKSYQMRQKGCEQYALDLMTAFHRGFIDAQVFKIELNKIKSAEAIQELGRNTLDPKASFWKWMGAAGRLLRFSYRTSAAWGFLSRSMIKRLAPKAFKLKYSRPNR
jgi:cellulose synthase/poly-beta-1,6-N-acetylglucosamine synthase-like glycosyltransferase